MVLVLSAEVAARLRFRGAYDFAKLSPTRLSDGRFVVSEGTLTDRRFARYRPLLATGSIEAASGLTFTDSEQIRLPMGSKTVYLNAAAAAHSFDIPAPRVHRFEVRYDESGSSSDKTNGNRRSELVSGDPAPRYGAGETLWNSFSFVVGPEKGGIDGSLPLNLISQWHSVDSETSRPPVLGVSLTSGDVRVYTRSDATGTTAQTHYAAARPTDGVVHHVVVAGLLGSSGHLDVWLDGTQIVDVDTPIGYYNDDAGARDLAYPHWGIYQNNIAEPLIVYIINIDWGTDDLSARVATPEVVTAPPGGWV